MNTLLSAEIQSSTCPARPGVAINPKFKALIPKLSPKEFSQLEANLLADGCRDPMVTWNGTLLDGHNRLEICERHKLPFKTVEVELTDENAAQVWIIRNQFGRRNITLACRCELAERLAEALKALAKENQKLSKGRGKKGSSILKNLKADAWKDAAEEAGVSLGSMSAFKFLQENASPEVLDGLMHNPEVKLHRIAKEVKDRKASQHRQSKRTEAAKGTALDSRITIGDFMKHADKIPDGSLSLIFTDPPYDREALPIYGDLGRFAAAKLADGGSLIAYIGQTGLFQGQQLLSEHLRYWWTIACVHTGPCGLMNQYGIRNGWKPVLWFVKGTRHDPTQIVCDTVSGAKEKTHHDWQQAQSEAEYWIEKLCPKDGIVCDPFLGGGTTGAAAQKLGRQWIGFEINPETARIAASRLAGADTQEVAP